MAEFMPPAADIFTPAQLAALEHMKEVMLAHPREIEREKVLHEPSK